MSSVYLPDKDVSIRIIDEDAPLHPLIKWPVGARQLRVTDTGILMRKRKRDKHTSCSYIKPTTDKSTVTHPNALVRDSTADM